MKHKEGRYIGLLGCLMILFFMIISTQAQLTAGLKYNFSFRFQGATHGTILLIIPFRVYYESFASVDFNSEKGEDGYLVFSLDKIPETGYMMRTSGFLGKTLVALTADYDLKNGLKCANQKLNRFYDPYYSKYIKRKKPFLFKILRKENDEIAFRRSLNGIHTRCSSDLTVRFQHHPEILNIDFNIYKILVEMLKAYNHSFLPESGLEGLLENPQQEWDTPEMDFSPIINRTVVLAARIMKRIKRFKQESMFQMHYRVTDLTSSRLEISGLAFPDVPIWGKYVITQVARKIIFKIKNRILLEDTCILHIENPRGNGLRARTALKLKH